VKTLNDIVRHPYEYSCCKHDLAKDVDAYVDEHLNGLTQAEFLRQLSDALEERLAEEKK